MFSHWLEEIVVILLYDCVVTVGASVALVQQWEWHPACKIAVSALP